MFTSDNEAWRTQLRHPEGKMKGNWRRRRSMEKMEEKWKRQISGEVEKIELETTRMSWSHKED